MARKLNTCFDKMMDCTEVRRQTIVSDGYTRISVTANLQEPSEDFYKLKCKITRHQEAPFILIKHVIYHKADLFQRSNTIMTKYF